MSPLIVCAENLIEQANKAYQAGDFEKSIELFEIELKNQKALELESPQLYYNLGNAYFRAGEKAKALLNYERALLIDPGDSDTRHNLEYVKTQIEDKIVEVDTFFIQSWFESIQNQLNSNSWAVVSICLFILFIITLTLYFFGRILSLRKTAFYIAIISFSLLILTNIFSNNQKKKITNRNTAIIMVGAVSVVSSPDINSKELFILHAGTKVKINKEDRNWVEIEVGNGSVGWIDRDKLEII